jgi:predicted ATPase
MNQSVGSTPTELYEHGLTQGHWRRDRAQELVLKSLDRIHESLNGKSNSLLDKIGAAFRNNTPVQGLYLWAASAVAKPF